MPIIALIATHLLSLANPAFARKPQSTWFALPACKAASYPTPLVKVRKYSNASTFTLEPQNGVKSEAVRQAVDSHPSARYIGNGPIFGEDGKPKGYMKSGGQLVNGDAGMDCFPNPSDGNWGTENSVFVAYRKRELPSGSIPATGPFQFKVVTAEFICKQCEVPSYVDRWKSLNPGKTDADFRKENKKWEFDGEDLVSCDQIDFAIQSGPGVLREGVNHSLEATGTRINYRSFIGVTGSGEPITVDVDGHASLACLGRQLLKLGVRDLLHRDSSITDVAFEENQSWVVGYPHQNPSAEAASLVVIY